MQAWHGVLMVAAIYEGVIGVCELIDGTTSGSGGQVNSTLASIEALPSVASLVANQSSTMAGVVDLAVAAGIYIFGLHKHLKA